MYIYIYNDTARFKNKNTSSRAVNRTVIERVADKNRADDIRAYGNSRRYFGNPSRTRARRDDSPPLLQRARLKTLSGAYTVPELSVGRVKRVRCRRNCSEIIRPVQQGRWRSRDEFSKRYTPTARLNNVRFRYQNGFLAKRVWVTVPNDV